MKTSLIGIFFTLCITSIAQTGSFEGTVLDRETNNPLIGVNVVLKNLSDTTTQNLRSQLYSILGTATNLNGAFKIRNLESGDYELILSYIGYAKEIINFTITESSIMNKIFYLDANSTEIDVVVVSAGKFEQKLEEVTVSMDIIKPALIESKNAVDLGALMNQSPGVQVIDGQANIRGGSGWSYNTGSRVLVMVDDMPLLSGDRGTVEWDMIPMENISQIEVIKGASSVLFGSSALNGVINVRTAYPKGDPEAHISIFSGYYDTPEREGLHWWGDDTRHFSGTSFSYAQYKNNTGLIIGANIYTNDGYKGGYVTGVDSSASNFGTEIPVSKKWCRFNFNTEHNSIKFPGLSFGINGNFMLVSKYESLIFAHDSIGYTPIDVPIGSEPVLFEQWMYNIDPHIKYINPNNNTQHSYKARFFKDDYMPFDEDEDGYSTVLYQEYQFQKTFDMKHGHFVSTSGITSNEIEGNYDDIYGEGGISNIKEMHNYSLYSQADLKYKRLNLSFGGRLEKLFFQEKVYNIPVVRGGLNFRLLQATYLRGSFGQGYRYPTIMESFVKTDYHPVYVYPGTTDNETLQAEHGWSAEVGLKQLVKIGEWKGMLDVAGFIMHYNDMIEFTFGQWALPSANPQDNFFGIGFKCINIGETEISGLEVSLVGEGKIGDIEASVLAGYTYARPVILNPNETYYEYENLGGETVSINYNTYDSNEFLADGETINPNYNPTGASYDNSNGILKYRHEHVAKFDINLTHKGYTSGLSIRYNSVMQNMDGIFSSGMFNAGGGGDGEPAIIDIGFLASRDRMLDGDLIVDWRIGKHIGETTTLSLIVDNLLNREYQTRPADLGAPRTVTIKLSAKI